MSSVHLLLQISIPKMPLGEAKKRKKKWKDESSSHLSYFRMKWKENFAHSKTWKFTDVQPHVASAIARPM